MTKKENMLRAIQRQNPEWVPNGMESLAYAPNPVVERPDAAGKDAFGILWALEEGAEGGTYPAMGGHIIHDIGDWRDKLVLPDLDAIDWSKTRAFAKTVDRDEKLVNGFVEMGLFERSYLLLGMEEALIAYLEEPEEMEAMLSVLADYKIELIKRYHEAAGGLDIIWYGDDWGTQNNLFIPPNVWRQTIKPHTQRIYDCMHELGIIVNQHSCGKIDSVFGDVVEMGADAWNPCQPCNDLAGLKREYGGKICFIGGIDSQFVLDRPGVTPEEVRAEVEKRMREMKQGGGYVAAPSHSVPYDPALVRAMVDAIRDFGRY